MYDTSGTQSICHAYSHDYNVAARLSWLKAELARGEPRSAARKAAREEERALSMESPRTSAASYAVLGLLLGLLPPAAMFGRFLFSFAVWETRPEFGLLALCVVMNLICCGVGRAMGSWAGGRIGDPRRRAWYELILVAALLGLLWGVVTGAAGGAIVFGIGAVAGALLALPVALAGFLLFAPLHRLLSHGGMMEARHLRPLALGVAGAIAALILSPGVFE